MKESICFLLTYLSLAFIKWDIMWVTEIPSLKNHDRFAMILYFALPQMLMYWINKPEKP